MANRNQAQSPETVISVDTNAADPAKAVTRQNADLAAAARGDDDGRGRRKTPLEEQMMKRMNRLGKNLERQFDQRLATEQAAWQRQRSELTAEIARLKVEGGGSDDKADQAHEAAINALKEKLEAAYEKGDSKASAAITLEISQLDAKYWAKKAAAAGQTTRESAAADGSGTRQQQQTERKGPTVAGSRFIKANADWWEDPEYLAENASANAIFLDLVNNEGFDAKSEETFVEVAKRLKAKFPELEVKAGRKGGDPDDADDEGDEDDDDADARSQNRDRGDDNARGTRRAAAGGFQDRGQANNRNRGGQQTLTSADIETMKACRLDPDNDKDVVQFMRERTALEAAS